MAGTFKSVSYDETTTVSNLLRNALKKFRLQNQDVHNYYLTILELKGTRSGRGNTFLKTEMRLKSQEYIHNVLTSLGISTLGNMGVGPADENLKIIINKSPTQQKAETINFKYESLEKEFAVSGLSMAALVQQVKSDFGIFGNVALYSPDTEKYISEKPNAAQVYDKIVRNGKAVIVVSKSGGMTRSMAPKSLSTTSNVRSIKEREQTPLMKSLPNNQSVDFDSMLDQLDESISYQKVHNTKISSQMDEFEHELDHLVATSPDKPLTHKTSSRRLSKIHSTSPSPSISKTETKEGDTKMEARDLFAKIAASKAELVAIEQVLCINGRIWTFSSIKSLQRTIF